MTTADELKSALSRSWRVGVPILLVWGLFIGAYQFAMDRRDDSDSSCFTDDFQNAEISTAPIALTLGSEEQLSLRFDQSRGTERDQVIVAAASKPPDKLEVAVSALGGDDQTIRSEDVRVRATSQRDTVLLDICVDARNLQRVQSGTYDGVVTFTDERVTALAVPVKVTLQARYLWWLSPLVLLMPFVALYVTWGSLPSTERPTLSHGLVRTVVASIAACAVVYGAQGLADRGWGGAEAAFGLVGVMYAAAAGAAVTVGSPSKRENPEPEPPAVR